MKEATVRKSERQYVYQNPRNVSPQRKKVVKRKKTGFIALIPKTWVAQKRAIYLMTGVLIVILFILIPQVIAFGMEKMNNNKIAEISSEIVSQQNKNDVMEREYLNAVSFSKVQLKAQELGMTEAKSKIVINDNIQDYLK